MAEQLSLQINVGGNVGESLGSLKKQLREAQADVGALADKFGATSQQAIQAAKRAAELKDRIGDAKALTDSFNPDQKFKALTSSLAGVAGGFAAVQGAIGLFGVESKEVEKTLLKVQSAMALSQGLEAVGNSIDSFKNLGSVIKDVAGKAFGSLKAAIISTGIGALVIGLGLLIANFDAVKKAVLNLVPGLGKVADFVGNLINKVTDFVGITSEAGRATAKLLKDNDAALKASERNLELNGDKYDEYTQRKIKANNEFKKKQNEFIKDETLSEAEKNKFIKEARDKANREILKSDEDRNTKQNELRLAESKKREEEEKERLEKQNKIEAGRLAAIKAGDAYTELAIENRQKAAEKAAQLALKQAEDEEDEMEKNRKQMEADAQKEIDISNNKIIQSNRLAEIDKKNAEIKRAEQEAQIGLATSTLDIIGGLVDKNSVAGKSIAISQAIINTYQGASKALAQGGIFGPVAAAATIAAGLINVKKIISTKVPSAKGGGDVGGGGGVPSISTAAPLTVQGQETATTNISQQSINALGNQAMRAYVVETDVTNSQQRIAAIQQRARFS